MFILEKEPGPCFKAALLFPDCSSLDFIYLVPSWIDNCSDLFFGTRGRSWRLVSVPYKKWGTWKDFCAQEPHSLPFSFTSKHVDPYLLVWKEVYMMILKIQRYNDLIFILKIFLCAYGQQWPVSLLNCVFQCFLQYALYFFSDL